MRKDLRKGRQGFFYCDLRAFFARSAVKLFSTVRQEVGRRETGDRSRVSVSEDRRPKTGEAVLKQNLPLISQNNAEDFNDLLIFYFIILN